MMRIAQSSDSHIIHAGYGPDRRSATAVCRQRAVTHLSPLLVRPAVVLVTPQPGQAPPTALPYPSRRRLSSPSASGAAPRSAWLGAAPAGGGGTRGGPPAPRVQRGRRRGMRGRARPAGRREKCFKLPIRSCSIQGRPRVVCVFDTSPIRVAPIMSVPARHVNRCYPTATFPQRSGITLRAWRCSQTGSVCEGEQCTDGADRERGPMQSVVFLAFALGVMLSPDSLIRWGIRWGARGPR
jgi:hypothetical protein